MKRKSFLLLLLLLLSIGTAQSQEPISVRGKQVYFVSMLQLIVTPEKFDGKFVNVTGLLNLEFEGDAIYISRDDLENGVRANSVTLKPTKDMLEQQKTLNHKFVLLEGKFLKGTQQGRIVEISRFEIWSDPSNPIGKQYETERQRLELEHPKK